MRAPLLSLAFVAMLLVSSTLANTTLNVNNSAVITPNVALWFDYVVFIITIPTGTADQPIRALETALTLQDSRIIRASLSDTNPTRLAEASGTT